MAKLFCCYTPAHEILYSEVFRPSVSHDYEVRAFGVLESGPGDYLSAEFLRCVRQKVRLVLRSMDEFPEELLIWSDVDIRFVDLPLERLLSDFNAAGKDIVFQLESPRLRDVNTGFFVCRSTPPVRYFFECVARELDSDSSMNEQMAANKLLWIAATENLAWGYLPTTYYARTHGWPPPRNLAIYHANFTKGKDAIGLKLAQFRELEQILSGGWTARVASVIRRVPGKIFPRRG